MNPVPTPALAWLQPAIHPVYARLLCAELRRRGFSEEAIMAGTRLDWASLHTDNRFLSFEQFRRLSAHALALSDCPWLGLEVGQRSQVSLHGALGQAASACASVPQVLALVQRYITLRQSIIGLELETHDGRIAVVAQEYLTAPEVREFQLGYLTTTLLGLLETVTGQGLHEDMTLEWPFPAPPWAAKYERLVAVNRFDAPALRGELSPALLNRPTLAADAEARRLAERECERQLAAQQQGGNLSQRVQARLAACQGHYPAQEEIAAEQHMSVRTLIRHLQDEGTSYQRLLDTVREELACWLLLQTPLPVDAIAERLGYSDTSNFSRTFRRWVGMTPGEFRDTAT